MEALEWTCIYSRVTLGDWACKGPPCHNIHFCDLFWNRPPVLYHPPSRPPAPSLGGLASRLRAWRGPDTGRAGGSGARAAETLPRNSQHAQPCLNFPRRHGPARWQLPIPAGWIGNSWWEWHILFLISRVKGEWERAVWQVGARGGLWEASGSRERSAPRRRKAVRVPGAPGWTNCLQKWLQNPVSLWIDRVVPRRERRAYGSEDSLLGMSSCSGLINNCPEGGKERFCISKYRLTNGTLGLCFLMTRRAISDKASPTLPPEGSPKWNSDRLPLRIGGLAGGAAAWHRPAPFSPGSCGLTSWSSGREGTQLTPLCPAYAWPIKVGRLFRSFRSKEIKLKSFNVDLWFHRP